MSDHFSGPRAIADPAADIADLYVFPSPERPGCLVLVLTVFPAAVPGALFSDAVAYRFRLRPATVAAERPAFEVGTDEYIFSCTFAAPVRQWQRSLGADGHMHNAVRRADLLPRQRRAGTEARAARLRRAAPGPVLHRPAGREGHRQAAAAGLQAQGTNVLQGQNVLSIVVEAETGYAVRWR